MNRVFRTFASFVAFSWLFACNGPDSQQAAPSFPPAQVAVIKVHSESVPVTRELVGRLQARRSAEVRARVPGILLERVYREGSDVKQGQILFRIDPDPMRARVHAREAALAKAKADAENAAATAKRLRGLEARKIVSLQELDAATASERATAAAVSLAQAELDAARLDLGYTTVSAPIAGRAGRALVTEGALVGQDEATELTRIEQVDSLYVNFSMPANDLGELRDQASGSAVEVWDPQSNASAQPAELDFSDLAVDPATGVVSLRATLANPKRTLLPGMYVNLRLTSGILDKAFVLPQSALGRDERGAFVLVVDAQGKVAERRVEIRGMSASGFTLQGALQDEERVIVEGILKARAGDTVHAVEAQASQAPIPGSR